MLLHQEYWDPLGVLLCALGFLDDLIDGAILAFQQFLIIR